MKKWKLLIPFGLVWMIFLEGALACQERYGLNENVTILDVVEKDGEGATCQIWIYFNNSLNQSGNMSRNGLSYTYDAGVLAQGTYSGSIECNNSGVSYLGECKFEVEEDDNVIIAFTILIPLVLSIFLLVWAFSLGEDHNVMRMFLSLLGLGSFFLSFHFSLISVVEFYNFPFLESAIGSTIYWMAWTFFLIVSYWVIYAIWKSLDIRKQRKEDKFNY